MAKKILVIDDDPLVLKTIRKLLQKEGHFVETAKSAQEGVKKIEVEDFHLIICDVRMPQMNGIEFTERIKESQKNKNKAEIPTILITGYASEETPIKAKELEVKDYILKPFDIDKLIEAVKKNLE
jgi:CheY-like chemotaxis protein